MIFFFVILLTFYRKQSGFFSSLGENLLAIKQSGSALVGYKYMIFSCFNLEILKTFPLWVMNVDRKRVIVQTLFCNYGVGYASEVYITRRERYSICWMVPLSNIIIEKQNIRSQNLGLSEILVGSIGVSRLFLERPCLRLVIFYTHFLFSYLLKCIYWKTYSGMKNNIYSPGVHKRRPISLKK